MTRDLSNSRNALEVALERGIHPYAIELTTGKRYFRVRSVLALGSGIYEITYPAAGDIAVAVITGTEVASVESEATK